MTEYILVASSTTTVDLTNLNPSVQYAMTNPLFIIPLGNGNQGVANLKLQAVRITITFDLTDGIGTGSNFEKLITLCKTSGDNGFGPAGGTVQSISFIWGTKAYYCTIESFIAGTQAGKKNYMPGCSLVLVITREASI